MLAQMLQMEFDREYDAQLRREEKKFNGDSKGTMTSLWQLHWMVENACKVLLNKFSTIFAFQVSISFENYRKVHPYEDSDSSEDEVDWQDTRDDPYRPGISAFIRWGSRNTKFSHGSLCFIFEKHLVIYY